MKLLVTVQDYPNLHGGKNEAYVHTRNVEYLKSNIKVDVLSFSAEKKYQIDGIQVLTEGDLSERNLAEYDFLVCHAPNIRNHYRFICKNGHYFQKIFFFFHGHEVLKIHKVYSKEYDYIQVNKIKYILRDIYDEIKCKIWHWYFRKTKDNYYCIFVSNWMYNEFLKWVKVKLPGKHEIIYNVVGSDFIKKSYDTDSLKEFDYVSIRSNLDGSKYCVDLINELAKHNPKSKFLLVGKGAFFEYVPKAENIIWINGTLNHEEVVELLNKCKCALMPTRTDAQGVMACEIATFGIPMITSDIPVCREVFSEFSNVAYISNDNSNIDLNTIYLTLSKGNDGKVLKYDLEHTVQKEIDLFKGEKQ